ncbi:MAG: hypothetical protein ACR2NG_05625 [Acidimicrobiia bacterium]
MEHPLIGAWTFTLDGGRRPGPEYATATFHPDGSMSITISGYTAHGAWRGTDSGTARFRALAPLAPGEGQTGWHTLTFDAQIDEDGRDQLSLDGEYARPTPSGNPILTTLTGAGERMVIDP